MSAKIEGTKITLTRGDSLLMNVSVYINEETEYIPQPGDVIRFAVKLDVKDEEPLFIRYADMSTMQILIEPEDTKYLEMGKMYTYDVELTTADGYVSTFIGPAVFYITPEVY